MVKFSPEERWSAERLIKCSYFDEVRQEISEKIKPTRVIDADIKFKSLEEAVEFLIKEIEILNHLM